MSVVLISGSPSAQSRSAALLAHVAKRLARGGVPTQSIAVRELPAEDLLHGRYDSAAIRTAGEVLEHARGVVVATPVYKAAHSGVLKAFLDLLKQNALAGKVVFPIAVGGSPAHMLAIDYSLRPVLAALGATHVLNTLYAIDKQIRLQDDGSAELEIDIALRLDEGVQGLVHALGESAELSWRKGSRRTTENAAIV
jgi:FMN reductase